MRRVLLALAPGASADALRARAPTPPDRRIMQVLADDAHRPVSDVAEEVGVTAKTARLRLHALSKVRVHGRARPDCARVRGAISFVLAVRFPEERRAMGHSSLYGVFHDLLQIGGPREETMWAFLRAPDVAGVDAARKRAGLPGAKRARVLLVKAMMIAK